MREWIRVNRPEGASLFDEVPSAYLSADPEAMRRTLARLTEEHGSIRQYVASIGVEAEVVEACATHLHRDVSRERAVATPYARRR